MSNHLNILYRTITYDQFGRQTSLTDPNAGTILYDYDAFDRVIWQRDARGYITTNRFDNLGRLWKVTEGGRVTTHSYLDDGPNIGRLLSLTVSDGTSHVFDYDHLGRLTRFTDVSGSNTFVTEYTYDRYGNLLTYTFPSSFRLYYVRDTNGFKTEIRENDAYGRVIWRLGSVNAMGQELTSTADGRLRTQEFNAFGQPTRMTVQGLMDYTYDYDPLTGNMVFRHNPFIGQYERFEYDRLNRLTTGARFSPCGNIEWKEGVGEFIYTAFRPHAVDTILGFLDPRFDHDISYTSFQKVQTIVAHNSSIPLSASFIYGPNRQRRQMNVIFGDNVLNKHYTQNFEVSYINGARVETKEYVFSPFGLVAIRNNGQINAVATDHLGSIVARFNPRVGDYDFFGFTPWGRRYRYEDGQKLFFDEKVISCQFSVLSFFQRGFTGHEHLDLFGLINMNGRIYDPIIARFLSPDRYVQAPTFTQSFNRYSYVWNNPLRFTDPSGWIVHCPFSNFDNAMREMQAAMMAIDGGGGSHWGHPLSIAGAWGVGISGFGAPVNRPNVSGMWEAHNPTTALRGLPIGDGTWLPGVSVSGGPGNWQVNAGQLANAVAVRDAVLNQIHFGGNNQVISMRNGMEVAWRRNIADIMHHAHDFSSNARDFWNDNRGAFGSIVDGANVFGELVGSSGITRIARPLGLSMSTSQARTDFGLWRSGELTGIAKADAVVNIISMASWQGATVSLGYNHLVRPGIMMLSGWYTDMEIRPRLHHTRRFP